MSSDYYILLAAEELEAAGGISGQTFIMIGGIAVLGWLMMICMPHDHQDGGQSGGGTPIFIKFESNNPNDFEAFFKNNANKYKIQGILIGGKKKDFEKLKQLGINYCSPKSRSRGTRSRGSLRTRSRR